MNRGSTAQSWACAAVAAAAVCALAGRLLDIRLLASGIRSSIPMAPSTAMAFLFLAAALHPGLAWSRWRPARLILLLPVFLIPIPAVVRMASLFIGEGWDAIAKAGPLDPWANTWVMSPVTAGLFFIMAGSAAFGMARGSGSKPAAWGMTTALAASCIILIGYLDAVPLFYGGSVIPVAATTAVCFGALSAALLFEVGRGIWPWNAFEGNLPKARMLRSFLPLSAGFVLLTAVLDSRTGIFNHPLGMTLILVVNLPCMAWLLVRLSANLGDDIMRAEDALRSSNEKFSKLFELSPAKVAIGTLEGKIVEANRAYAQFLGFSRDEMVGKSLADLGVIDGGELKGLLDLCHSTGDQLREVAVSMRTRDGEVRDVLLSADIISFLGVPHRLATLVDITERRLAEGQRRKLEAQLSQSQKMESVGRLAGGIAHDFNNILTAIHGYGGFAMEGLAEGDPRRQDLAEVLGASERAARLTRQLLAFSRKQILKPQVLDVNAAMGDIVKMLKRLIGENITLETHLYPQPCMAKVDFGQMEQVFLNLAVNARDAMPRGGTLTFETRVVAPSADFSANHPDLTLGPLVCLSVRDTGCGMSDEVKGRLFEPFFTTKEQGKGTGLGLSMVYGIVKQSGGEIEVESALERGTTFRIYLPHIAALPQVSAEPQPVVLEGNETVLLVEDEESVRRLGTRALTRRGYAVLAAADGQEALKVLAAHGKPVDLLVTDVVMPGMSGRDLARKIAETSMAHRTLFVSGYTDDAIVHHGILDPGVAFLNKPFTPDALLLKIRDVLDGPADKARP